MQLFKNNLSTVSLGSQFVSISFLYCVVLIFKVIVCKLITNPLDRLRHCALFYVCDSVVTLNAERNVVV